MKANERAILFILCLYNFIMLTLDERNSVTNPSPSPIYREALCSGRSLQSADSYHHKTSAIAPWHGDEFYSRIKKSIHQSTRAKSATIKSVKLKSYENKASKGFAKMNTVQIQLTPLPSDPIKKSITKWSQPISSQIIFKGNFGSPDRQPEKEKQYKFTTVSFLQPQPIHQRKMSVKSMQPKMKVVERLNTEVSRKVVETNANFQMRDKRKSLLFFFEVRNPTVINREKMVMKLRNIEKGRASRALNHIN